MASTGEGSWEGLRPHRTCLATSRVTWAPGPRALVQALLGGVSWPWGDPSPAGHLCPHRADGGPNMSVTCLETGQASVEGRRTVGRRSPGSLETSVDSPSENGVPAPCAAGPEGREEKRAPAERVRSRGSDPGLDCGSTSWQPVGGLRYMTVPCPRPRPQPAGVRLAWWARRLIWAL